jgi:hypothetical protein
MNMEEMQIGQRVLGFCDREATIIAKSLDIYGKTEKYKIQYDGVFGGTEWRYKDMVNEIITSIVK